MLGWTIKRSTENLKCNICGREQARILFIWVSKQKRLTVLNLPLYWSGFKSEAALNCSCAKLCSVAQSCLTLCNLMDCNPPGSSVHGDSPGKNTGVVAMPSSWVGIKPKSPALQANSLLTEPPGKPPVVITTVQKKKVGTCEPECWKGCGGGFELGIQG